MESLLSRFAGSLSTLVGEEAGESKASAVRLEIRRLQRKLLSISAMVKDAEGRVQHETINHWFKDLKEVIYDADDIIELYSPNFEQLSPNFVSSSRRYEFINSITEINARLDKIANSRVTEGLSTFDLKFRPGTSPLLPHSVVGETIAEDKRVLCRLLINSQNPETQLFAVSGMGGIGKTTLAQEIYNDPEIKHNFSIRIWVVVSQHFEETDLLRSIVSDEAYTADAGLTRDELQAILSGVVKGGRFFIVLDDVWSADVWETVLQSPLQSGAPGSRVLITTRDENIAKQMGAVDIRHVQPLGVEDSWSLLCEIVSEGDDEAEMEGMRNIGMEIVQKCEGLPLALESVGRILSTQERSQCEWSNVLDHLKSTQDRFEKDYMSALSLSYDVLPSSIKPCFLYCSLLPQNRVIARRDLMQMWISESFVELHPGAASEDLAEDYYAKISATNLLQSESYNMKEDEGCRIHDSIRDLAIILAQDDNHSGDLHQLGNKIRVRRLSIGSKETILSPDLLTAHKGLRSLLMFDNMLSDYMLKNLLEQLSHLRVLDLRGSAIQEVTSSLGRLFNLRYLNLSGTMIRHLPESIKDLKNLLFLNLNGCIYLHSIPNDITQLNNLRSLDILHTDLKDMPSRVRGMKHLNTLLGFLPGNSALEELKDLEQMRYLEIRKLNRAVKAGAQLRNKKNLRSLVLAWEQDSCQAIDLDMIEDILEDLQPPPSIGQLTIECYSGLAYPKWMSFHSGYPNLVSLCLKSCIFSTSLPSLGQLPKLKNLCISASKGIATVDTEFFGHSELAFPELERLVIEEMDNWEEWRGPKDGKIFPVLRETHLKKCPKLRSLPQCLQFTTTLTNLVIEAAENIRVIEDLRYITELRIKDCPNLERISYLTKLKTLEIVRCPLLLYVGDVEGLKHLMLEDFALESLPGWLAPNKLINLRTLEITGNHGLYQSLQMGGPERHKIATIPYVYTNSNRKSRSNTSLVIAKNRKSASPATSHSETLLEGLQTIGQE